MKRKYQAGDRVRWTSSNTGKVKEGTVVDVHVDDGENLIAAEFDDGTASDYCRPSELKLVKASPLTSGTGTVTDFLTADDIKVLAYVLGRHVYLADHYPVDPDFPDNNLEREGLAKRTRTMQGLRLIVTAKGVDVAKKFGIKPVRSWS